jgi:hypothetical protein
MGLTSSINHHHHHQSTAGTANNPHSNNMHLQFIFMSVAGKDVKLVLIEINLGLTAAAAAMATLPIAAAASAMDAAHLQHSKLIQSRLHKQHLQPLHRFHPWLH